MFKKILISALAVFMFATNVYAGTLDIRDAIAALNITEKHLEYDERLDMNSDGVISLEDCVMILRKLLNTDEKTDREFSVTINGKNFVIETSDTKAAEEFAALCPVTYNMSELNGNEKYVYTDTSFTAASQKVGHINAGDIMLYGDDCVVLFYESFDTQYTYTKIGHITNTDGLKETVGKGSITAVFAYNDR